MKIIFIIMLFLALVPLASAVSDSDLIPYVVLDWEYNEGSGTVAVDSSNNGRFNGTTNYSSDYVAGKVGAYSMNFSLSNVNYTFINDNDALTPASISLEAWLYLYSYNPTYITVIGKGDEQGGASDAFELRFSGTSGKPEFCVTTAGNYDCLTLTGTLTLNTWTHLAATYNSTGAMNLYIDGNLNGSKTHSAPGAVNNELSPLSVGGLAGQSGGNRRNINGIVDSARVYNKSLIIAEVQYLYNSSFGRELLYTAGGSSAASDYGIVSLSFWNDTRVFKDFFDEVNENFYVGLNFTNSSGSAITSGQCLVNASHIVDERVFNDSATTMCSTCVSNSLYFTAIFNASKSDNDLPYFRACFVNNVVASLNVTVNCSGFSYSKVYSSPDIPSCSATAGLNYPFNEGTRFFQNFTHCVTNATVGFKVVSTANGISQAINVSRIRWGREFDNQTFQAAYNASSGNYQLNKTFRSYTPGPLNFSGSCNLTDGFNASTRSGVTIGNTPPFIVLSGILAGLNFTPFINNSLIEFENGIYTFIISITDRTLKNESIIIGNRSNIIQSFTSTSAVALNSSNFRDFLGNPFYVNISAFDQSNNFSRMIYFFNNTDTIYPYATGFNNASYPNGTLVVFNVTLVDESIFMANITCDNGFNSSVFGIQNVGSYLWDNASFNIRGNTTCTLYFCDGHTGNELKRKWSYLFANNTAMLRSNRQKVMFWSDNNITVAATKKVDRFSFKVDWPGDSYVRKIYYKGDGASVYIDSNKYKGWIVNPASETWFDLNGFKGSVDAYSEDGVVWELTLTETSKKPINSVNFDSIGELNCKAQYATLTVTVEKDQHTALQVAQCPNTVEGSIILLIVAGLLFGLFLINLSWIRIPLLNLFCGLGFIFLSFTIMGCQAMAGYVVFAFGLVMILMSFINPN